jgi:S-DNA-T family DNA segregation ATPase FtsK/SpoIIIE
MIEHLLRGLARWALDWLRWLVVGVVVFLVVVLGVAVALLWAHIHLSPQVSLRTLQWSLVGVSVSTLLAWGFVWARRHMRFQRVCRRVGLVVTESKPSGPVYVTPQITSYTRVQQKVDRIGLMLPAGITAERVQAQAEALASGMGWHAVRVSKDARRMARVWLDVARRPLPLRVSLSRLPVPTKALEFQVGLSPWGPLLVDLAACPHLLIAGETGAGKSTFLHSFLASLLRPPTADATPRLHLWLIDLKGGLEFMRYEATPSVVQVAGEWETALAVLQGFVDELERRLVLLRSLQCASVTECWQRFPTQRATLLPGVLVIDELAQLTLAPVSRPEHSRLLALLHRATSVGRALGLHVVVATQRPDMEVLPGNIKANIPAVLCFRVRDETNSRLVLDDEAAAQLPVVPGRGIWRYGADLTEVQAPYCDEREMLQREYVVRWQWLTKGGVLWGHLWGRMPGIGAPWVPPESQVPERRVEEMGSAGFR